MSRLAIRIGLLVAGVGIVSFLTPPHVFSQDSEQQAPDTNAPQSEPAEDAPEEDAPQEDAAQEDAPQEDAAEKDAAAPGENDNPAPTQPPASQAADENVGPTVPAADVAAVQATYEKAMQDWKNVLKELRALRVQYQNQGQSPELLKKWNELIKQGESMLPVLRSSSLAAYQASPNSDPQLTRFLVKLLEDDVRHDRYEACLEVGKALADNDCGISQVYDLAGIACFATHDFANAEKYLKEAEARGVLSSQDGGMQGERYLPLVEEYKQLWQEEQALRAKETEANDLPQVRIETSKGVVVAELFENEAPDTVGNFISLIEKGFYDGLKFHRVLAGFMAQGGCPLGDGTGDAGYKIYCECDKDDHRKHFRGSLSMAKGTPKDTGGSQFFFCLVPTAHLNGQHTVFGRVIEGMDVVTELQRIKPSDPAVDPSESAVEPDIIKKVTVIRKRDHEYKPNKVQ